MKRLPLVLSLLIATTAPPGCTTEGTVVVQGPLTIKTTNKHTTPIYFDWTAGASTAILLEAADGTGWLPRKLSQPACMLACSAVPKGTNCGIDCKPAPRMVKIVAPGESVSFTWNSDLFITIDDHCPSDLCFVKTGPGPGLHRIRVCRAEDWTCVNKPCPEAKGVYPGSPQGNLLCAVAEFEIPYDEPELELLMEEP